MSIEHRHIPELDGLRAIAVIAVVLFHCGLGSRVPGGFIGVDIFFVLSAFLITSILAREFGRSGAIDLKRFYTRRLLRLMPALLLFLVTYVVAAPFVWPAHPHGRDALLTGLYLSDYSYTFWKAPLYLQHSWSLSVEEHFYLLWPLLLPVVTKARRPLAWLAAAWLILGLWRMSFIADWISYYYRFDTRATGLIAGIILYFQLPRLSLRPGHMYLATILFAMLAACASIGSSALFIPAAEIMAAIMIGCVVTGHAGVLARPLQSKVAVGLGKLSYGIYLWHFPFAYAVREDLGFAATSTLTLAFSITAAAISYWSVEAWGRQTSARRGLSNGSAMQVARQPSAF